jgi:hypothetical protein
MNCSKCKNIALKNVEYAGKVYCEKHFLELIEKRIRRNLRTRQLLDIKKKYVLIDDDSSEAKILEYFLIKIFNNRLMFEKKHKSSKNDALIVPTNLDEQTILFLNSFLQNKINNSDLEIMPLEVVTQSEIEIVCAILKIKFIPKIKEDILFDLEKKYPGTKFSLFQSKRNIEDKQVKIKK